VVWSHADPTPNPAIAAPILRRADLLALAPSERRALLERAARHIELERVRACPLRVWDGHPRAYHLQALYARRQGLMNLAQRVGCGDWDGIPVENVRRGRCGVPSGVL